MQRLLLLSHVFYLNSIIPLARVPILAYLFTYSYALLPESQLDTHNQFRRIRCMGHESANGNGKHIESVFSFGFYCADWNTVLPLISTSKLHTQLIKLSGDLV